VARLLSDPVHNAVFNKLFRVGPSRSPQAPVRP
jgi:hypothetical protein